MNEETMKKHIQTAIDRRLSGLREHPGLAQRIIASEKGETPLPIRRKLSLSLVIALLAVLLMASIALAEHLNLFSFFGARDERYTAVAPQASLVLAEPALIAHNHLGQVQAAIDSAYFDGLSLSLAYRVANAQFVEAYSPNAEELATMQPGEAIPLALAGGAPGAAIYEAYNAAIANGTPYGYRQYSIYASDHSLTDDGVALDPSSGWEDYESNALCVMLEFEVPLPAEVRHRSELHVGMKLYQQETAVWFDGKECLVRHERSEVGRMEAVIPRTEGALQMMEGRGSIHGAACTATAEVTQMAAVITLTSDAPFGAFLAAPPAGTDSADCWVEITAFDENGNRLEPLDGFALDSRTTASVVLQGTGSLPRQLTLYMRTVWEGADGASPPASEGIVLTLAQ